MNKSKIFAFLVFSLLIGSSIVFIVPAVSTRRDYTRATAVNPKAGLILSPANGETVSGIVMITTSSAADIFIDGIRVARKTTSFSWNTLSVADGAHVIRAKYRSINEVITVTVDNSGPPPDPQGDKFALICGISDYDRISDLSYCDEDATDWYNYLLSIGYLSENIIVLGDSDTYNFPKYDGLATEYNIKFYINWLINLDCEEISFITSGHGGGDGLGSSFNCAWDCAAGVNGEDGYLDDYEFEAAFTGVVAPKVFVFMDHCYSGGMIPEFSNACGSKLYMTTTCTEDGYGWDMGAYQNGAWTYFFLEYSLMAHFGSDPLTPMESAFAYAAADYPFDGGDTPQEQDNYPGDFTL